MLSCSAVETNVNFFTKFVATCVSLAGIHHAFDHWPHRDDMFICDFMIKAHVALAKSCGSSMMIMEGFELHGHVLKIGFSLDLYVSTALVNLYAKFGEMFWATKLLDEMSDRSLILWTALISGSTRSADMS
ncbi:hypothetical protein Q3G72_027632 [Acer saccharum]|nr:hypothetical protein Q3G72_027632 [Acer saccharum]